MDVSVTLLVTLLAPLYLGAGVLVYLLVARLVWWSQIDRVRLTLADQEEALASLFDKLNTVMARWRKREQREREAEGDVSASEPSDRDQLRRLAGRRFLADRGIAVPTLSDNQQMSITLEKE